MRILAASIVLIGSITSGAAQNRPPLEVVPLFTNVGVGPGFMLTCFNDGSAPFQLGAGVLDISVKVDGKPVPRTGQGGSGGAPTIQPGGSFKVMFVLDQERLTFTMSPDFGARLRTHHPYSVVPGPHTIEFQCFGRTSATLPFYWEHGAIPK